MTIPHGTEYIFIETIFHKVFHENKNAVGENWIRDRRIGIYFSGNEALPLI